MTRLRKGLLISFLAVALAIWLFVIFAILMVDGMPSTETQAQFSARHPLRWYGLLALGAVMGLGLLRVIFRPVRP